MKPYFVYILKCADERYYTGITNNLERRFYEHQTGLYTNCYTFKRRPLELVYSPMFYDVLQAITFEIQIKRWTRKRRKP
ncbi:MAG TPA: GIY-YIG nuclease family protein [Ginsengibacter sp.]|nr:GIY-YIG nuclease family protein [Ginsengibacter sp.]HRP17706.1 GIY-YIG nuclease family protein [Ginsengibacter sp.]HRP45290.1 GIY-YIG nuclease family protein [Ginsengibacter sp.]